MTVPSFPPINSRVAVARQLPLRAAALVGFVLLAYNYSLMTLARGLTLDTPLAYLALVPLIALILGVTRLRIESRSLPIHDRQVDWIVGLGLLGSAAAVLTLMPQPTTSTFWLQRIDLLTLPLFVSGLIALLFGVRRLWSLKGAIAFLLLAWPVPYTMFLAGPAGSFTELTARLAAAVTSVLPVARVSSSDPSLFFVGSGAQQFSLSIGAACAGVNSFIGFLLVGTALLYVVRGPLIRRAAWLSIGLAMVFLLNVVRILAIFGVGAVFGQAAALDVLHPVAGLLVFNAGVLAMIALVPRFGLRFMSLATPVVDAARSDPVRRVRPALLVGVVIAALLAATNATYARFDAISSGLADARLTSFDVRSLALPRWQSRYLAAFALAKQYFGGSATWDRVLYWPTAQASLSSSRSVYIDVITTDDPGTFAAYGMQACYQFHGYDIAAVTTADIGAGVRAQIIDYYNPKVKSDWSALWWEWPYRSGFTTRYERVVIHLPDGPKAQFRGITAADVVAGSPQFAQSDQFLVTLARTVVRTQLGTASR